MAATAGRATPELRPKGAGQLHAVGVPRYSDVASFVDTVLQRDVVPVRATGKKSLPPVSGSKEAGASDTSRSFDDSWSRAWPTSPSDSLMQQTSSSSFPGGRMESARRQLELYQAEQQAERDEVRKLEAALSASLVQERQVCKKVQRQRDLKRQHERRTDDLDDKIRRLRRELQQHEETAARMLQKGKYRSSPMGDSRDLQLDQQANPHQQQEQMLHQQQEQQQQSLQQMEASESTLELTGESSIEDLGPLVLIKSFSGMPPPPQPRGSLNDTSLSMSASSLPPPSRHLQEQSQQSASSPTLKEWFRDKDGGVRTRSVARPATVKMEMDEEQQREAIRRAVIDAAGSVKAAFRSLDLSGSGTISQSEFERGMERLGVDYVSLTGIRKIGKVFKLFDAHKNGALDMLSMFGKDAMNDEPQRLSTPEFWHMWVKRNRDFSKLDTRLGPRWAPANPDEELQQLFQQANTRKEVADKKNWMRATMRRLKSRGKSDARCRELIALHLPRGTGPKDREDVQTFSENEVRLCKRSYTDQWQEPTRNIQKQIYDLRDKRRDMMISRQRLEVMICPPQRAKAEEQLIKASTVKGLELGLSKVKDEEPEQNKLLEKQKEQEREKDKQNQKAQFRAMLAKHGFDVDQVENLYRIYMKHSDPVSDTISRHGFETLLSAICQNRTLVESDLDAWWTQLMTLTAKYEPATSTDAAPRTRATFEHFMEWWATSELRTKSVVTS